jgi:hypothetical protein
VLSAVARHARYLRRRLRSRFRASAAADEQVMLMDMDSDSRTLLMAFGGISGGLGMPPFEFLSLTGQIPVKRLFVRDLRQAWYHHGLPLHGDTLSDVTDTLRELIAEHEVQRLVVTGNSAGGYASLVFGTLLGADVVLCFAPQTVLDLDVLDSIGDHRWDERLGKIHAAGGLDEAWIDLRPALARAGGDTRYSVFFDDSMPADRLHAERLRGIDGIRLYRFGRGAHELVRSLRDCGALERLLRRSLDASGTSASAGDVMPGDGTGGDRTS